MKEKNNGSPSRLDGARRLLTLAAAVLLLLAVFIGSAPLAKKKNVIQTVGGDAAASLRLVPAMLSYYDGSALSALSAREGGDAYREVSGALAAVRGAGGFDSVIFVVQDGEQYLCAADGHVGSGENVYAANSLLSVEKPMKTLLGRIFSGKSDGGVANDLVTGRAGGKAAAVLLPVFGADGALLGVLVAECSVGDAAYHMAGKINLYLLALVLALLGAVLFLLASLLKKLKKAPPEEHEDTDTVIYTPAESAPAQEAPAETAPPAQDDAASPESAAPANGSEEPKKEESPHDGALF